MPFCGSPVHASPPPPQEYHHELLLLAWQALSTKILARRSVKEVDVDDGTYTKLHGV